MCVKDLAAGRDVSVDVTLLHLLREAVGLDRKRERLRRYQTWTEEVAREFDEVLRAQRTIDGRLWSSSPPANHGRHQCVLRLSPR